MARHIGGWLASGRAAMVCGVTAAAVGSVVLVEWLAGLQPSVVLRSGRIPMAPNTAVALTLLGLALCILARWRSRPAAARFALVAGGLVGCLGLLSIAQAVFRLDLGVDHLARHVAMLRGTRIPAGVMSPLTAACLVLAGLSLVLLTRGATCGAAAALMTVVAVTGAADALGYQYRVPLLYSGGNVPMALGTALGLLVLGLGMILAGGPEVWPLRSLAGPSARARLLRTFLPFTVIALFVADSAGEAVGRLPGIHPVLASALCAFACLALASAVSSRLAASIGADIDRAETGLRVSECQYRDLVENVNSIVAEWDTDFRVTFVNEYGLAFFGYTREEVIGLSAAIVLPDTESTGRDLTGILPDTIADPSAFASHVTESVTKDGMRAWIAWTNQGVFDADGYLTGMRSVGNDITALKQAEDRIIRLNSLLRAISEVNALIVREDERPALLQGACDILAAAEGHVAAWIALRGDDGRFPESHFAGVGGREAALRAMFGRGELPPCAAEAGSAPGIVPWTPCAEACAGCAFCGQGECARRLSVRLERGDRHWGLLLLCTEAGLADDSEEHGLLEEVAADLCLALHAMETASERRDAEKALRESEFRYRHLVEDVNSIVIEWDAGLRFNFINGFGLEFLGYSADEVIGHELALIVPETETTGRDLTDLTARVVADPAAFANNVNENVTKTGRRVWVAWANQPIYDADGRLTGIRSVGNDITALKQAEDRVLRLNSLLRAISDVNALIVRETQRAPLLQAACDVMASAEGHLAAWIALRGEGGGFSELCSAGAGASEAAVREMLEHGELPPCATDALAAPGVTVWLPSADACAVCAFAGPGRCPERVSSVRLEREGRLWGLLLLRTRPVLVQDREQHELLSQVAGDLCLALQAMEVASEHRQAEDALHKSEERYRVVFECSPTATGISRDGVVLYANAACLRLFGVSHPAAMVGTPASDWSAPQSSEAIEAALLRLGAMPDAVPIELEIAGLRADGTEVPLHLQKARVVLPDGPAVLTFFTDLTERRRAERAERLASVGQLAAGVAHEFNNVLAAMSLRAELATALGTQRETDKLIETVHTGVERGAAVSRNLLAFSRPDEPKRRPIILEEALEPALALAAREIANGEIRLVRDYAPNPGTVFADRGQLQQVFLNLAINACHAMGRGGTLTVASGRAIREDGGEDIIATFSDTGTGIRPDDLARVFEPFFSTKGRLGADEHSGSGLGLSVSQGILAAHGGRIAVTSEPGRGSTFTVRLAACTGAEGDEAQQVSGRLDLSRVERRATIVVAEDEEAIRDTITTALAARGHAVVRAVNAEEALAALSAGDVDLVISDLMMPGGGRHVLEAAQALPSPVPVVLITGYGAERLAPELAAQGAVACLQKPLQLRDLLATVSSVLSQARLVGRQVASARARLSAIAESQRVTLLD